MKKRDTFFLSVFLSLLIPVLFAETSGQDALKLVPQPKEVQPHAGSFRIGPATKILVAFGHQAEDRIAAETLAEEIHDQSGLNIPITGSKEKGKQQASTIELARLQDVSVRKFLESKGLRATSIGDQGYLLFADSQHLIVAANTGQGLFYGVQTLRQLLRKQDGKLICPAVSIRDWPTMAWRGVQDDISRGPSSDGRIHEAADSHSGLLQGQYVCSLYGERI